MAAHAESAPLLRTRPGPDPPRDQASRESAGRAIISAVFVLGGALEPNAFSLLVVARNLRFVGRGARGFEPSDARPVTGIADLLGAGHRFPHGVSRSGGGTLRDRCWLLEPGKGPFVAPVPAWPRARCVWSHRRFPIDSGTTEFSPGVGAFRDHGRQYRSICREDGADAATKFPRDRVPAGVGSPLNRLRILLYRRGISIRQAGITAHLLHLDELLLRLLRNPAVVAGVPAARQRRFPFRPDRAFVPVTPAEGCPLSRQLGSIVAGGVRKGSEADLRARLVRDGGGNRERQDSDPHQRQPERSLCPFSVRKRGRRSARTRQEVAAEYFLAAPTPFDEGASPTGAWPRCSTLDTRLGKAHAGRSSFSWSPGREFFEQ